MNGRMSLLVRDKRANHNTHVLMPARTCECEHTAFLFGSARYTILFIFLIDLSMNQLNTVYLTFYDYFHRSDAFELTAGVACMMASTNLVNAAYILKCW